MAAKKHVLKFETREDIGKGAGKRSLLKKKIAGVIYGGEKNTNIDVNQSEFSHLLTGISENSILSLEEGKNKRNVLIKDYQYDIITDSVTHLDFLEFRSDAAVVINIPIHLHGAPIGVREGGLQENRLTLLKVKCLAKDIPESIDLEIGDLIIGQAIHVKDLPAIKNVRVLTSPEQTIVTVTHTRETKQAETDVVATEEPSETA